MMSIRLITERFKTLKFSSVKITIKKLKLLRTQANAFKRTILTKSVKENINDIFQIIGLLILIYILGLIANTPFTTL